MLQARNLALYHTLAAGRSKFGRALIWMQLGLEFSAMWFLVFFMMMYEQVTFHGWIDHAVIIKD